MLIIRVCHSHRPKSSHWIVVYFIFFLFFTLSVVLWSNTSLLSSNQAMTCENSVRWYIERKLWYSLSIFCSSFQAKEVLRGCASFSRCIFIKGKNKILFVFVRVSIRFFVCREMQINSSRKRFEQPLDI